MQIALRKFTVRFHPCLKQAITMKNHLSPFSKGTLRMANLRKEHASIMELMKRVSFGFVSLAIPFHKQLKRPQVEEFLNAHQLEHKTTDTGYALKYCPFCPKPHKNDPTNFYTLNVSN